MKQELLAFLAAVAGMGLTALRQWIVVNVTPQKIGAVVGLARTVVVAAEKMGLATGAAGADKYEYAEQALITAARRFNIRLKPEEANAFVHAALAELEGLYPVEEPDLAEAV